MTKKPLTPTATTARHFTVGARIAHGEFGIGTICLHENGERYPRFDNGAVGTSMTRVRPAPETDDAKVPA